MTRLMRFAILVLVAMSIATPAFAKMAAIQTAVPIDDASQSSIQAAAEQAVDTAVRGAVAMGLSQVKLQRAVVVNKMVIIQILATDGAGDGQDRKDQPSDESLLPSLEPEKAALSHL